MSYTLGVLLLRIGLHPSLLMRAEGRGTDDWKSRRAGVPPGVHLRGRCPVRCGTWRTPCDATNLLSVFTWSGRRISRTLPCPRRRATSQRRSRGDVNRSCSAIPLNVKQHKRCNVVLEVRRGPRCGRTRQCTPTRCHPTCNLQRSSHVPPATRNLQPATVVPRPTRNLQPATFIASRCSPDSSRL